MTLDVKLKKGRLEKGLSQAEVAKQLNISRQSISKWENGNNYPDIDNLLLLSKIYDIPIEQLLVEEEIEEDKGAVIKSQTEESISNKTGNGTNDKRSNVQTDEGLLLLIITLVSSLLTPIGIIIATVILHRNKKENTYSKMINILCVFSILINIYFTYSFVSDWFKWNIQNDVQLVE